MSTPAHEKRRVLRRVSGGVLCAGLALVAFMVVAEGEPGALPLGLVLLGAAGLLGTRRRSSR